MQSGGEVVGKWIIRITVETVGIEVFQLCGHINIKKLSAPDPISAANTVTLPHRFSAGGINDPVVESMQIGMIRLNPVIYHFRFDFGKKIFPFSQLFFRSYSLQRPDGGDEFAHPEVRRFFFAQFRQFFTTVIHHFEYGFLKFRYSAVTEQDRSGGSKPAGGLVPFPFYHRINNSSAFIDPVRGVADDRLHHVQIDIAVNSGRLPVFRCWCCHHPVKKFL